MFLNQVSSWVCAFLYLSYYESAYKIDPSTIYTFLGELHLFLALCLALFFRLIKPQYKRTFYSTVTGRQLSISYFVKGVDDASKVVIFGDNVDLWRDIAPDVKAWTLSNWSRWESESPEWFTTAFKESVPDDMILKEALAELNKKAGGSRRRSSVGFLEVRRTLVAGRSGTEKKGGRDGVGGIAELIE